MIYFKTCPIKKHAVAEVSDIYVTIRPLIFLDFLRFFMALSTVTALYSILIQLIDQYYLPTFLSSFLPTPTIVLYSCMVSSVQYAISYNHPL